jgi:hypothetical protein
MRDSNPAFEALAIDLARKIDSPEHRAQVHQLGKEMRETLKTALELDKPKKKSNGRLYSIARMTARTTRKTG